VVSTPSTEREARILLSDEIVVLLVQPDPASSLAAFIHRTLLTNTLRVAPLWTLSNLKHRRPGVMSGSFLHASLASNPLPPPQNFRSFYYASEEEVSEGEQDDLRPTMPPLCFSLGPFMSNSSWPELEDKVTLRCASRRESTELIEADECHRI
jgi:hypothetical protein